MRDVWCWVESRWRIVDVRPLATIDSINLSNVGHRTTPPLRFISDPAMPLLTSPFIKSFLITCLLYWGASWLVSTCYLLPFCFILSCDNTTSGSPEDHRSSTSVGYPGGSPNFPKIFVLSIIACDSNGLPGGFPIPESRRLSESVAALK